MQKNFNKLFTPTFFECGKYCIKLWCRYCHGVAQWLECRASNFLVFLGKIFNANFQQHFVRFGKQVQLSVSQRHTQEKKKLKKQIENN